ncbi:MAG: hypothetical protein ONB31_09915 [candidate division KSB1 bacterium]|nr:hypothetical protein [candidate division KSB1 bacterium]MDZ7336061.1 hypothetical protein [candidate division KSB1 bacterium]MDZ7358051.1 hypothetical protein [candidate division KSB1 bacterium]MDZ7402246.1 hypothetical protein [candidate division KSB1 bacterium]
MMRIYFRTIIALLAGAVIATGCAAYKMKAIRAQRDHRYDLAIKFALRHLNSHPNDQSLIKLLDQAAQGYFEQIQQNILHFERLDDWERVTQLAQQGYQTLFEVSRVVGTTYPTKSQLEFLQTKREQSRFRQADELYTEAMKLYQHGDYATALQRFKAVNGYLPHFKDTDRLLEETQRQLAAKEYQNARNLLNQSQLEAALEAFQRVANYQPNYLDTQQQVDRVRAQLADKYFLEGQRHFRAGDYKNAYQALKNSIYYQPDHSSAKQLYEEAKEKLTVRMAIFPFTATKMETKFGELVSQRLLAQALPRRSEFIVFLEREHLQKIFEEQALSQTGAIDEKTAVEVGKLSGVNVIVVGSITLISQKVSGPTARQLTGYYDQSYRDAKGIQRSKKEPFQYTAYEVQRSAEVNISYRFISVETGEILFNESLSRVVDDHAEWITCPKEFVKYLSYSDRNKINAPKEPKTLDSLINQAIDSLTDQVASKMISRLAPF